MKEETKTKILHALVTGESWLVVQEIIDKHITKFSSIDDIDLDKDNLKFQLQVRREAKKRLEAIDAELKSYNSQEKKVDPLNRSFK